MLAVAHRYDALCKNEFKGLELETEGLSGFPDGEAVLHSRAIDGSVASSVMQQVRPPFV